MTERAGENPKAVPHLVAIAELLGGRLDVASIVMGTEVGQNIRVIAVFSETRIATFPDVPTVKEQGYDVIPSSFGGLLAPIATPGLILISMFLVGVGWNFLFTGSTTLAMRAYRPEEKNRAQGAINFFVFATMAFTSFASGALVTTQGWTWLNWGSLLPVAITGAGLLWLRLLRQH